jgi:hypothetical protein
MNGLRQLGEAILLPFKMIVASLIIAWQIWKLIGELD